MTCYIDGLPFIVQIYIDNENSIYVYHLIILPLLRLGASDNSFDVFDGENFKL